MKLYILIILLLLPFIAAAQYNETIRTVRPGISAGAFTTGKNVFQLQSGVSLSKIDQPADVTASLFNFTNVLRYGVMERVEIRAAFRISNDVMETIGQESTATGLSFWNLGARINVLDNTGTYKPSIGFQAQIEMNAVSEDFKQDHIAPSFVLLHSQKLANWLGLTSNWGVGWNRSNADARGFYSLKFSIPVAQRITLHLENFGDVQNEDFDTRFDIGFGYLANNDLLFDLMFGYGNNESVSHTFIDGGLSWRIKTN